MSAETTGDDSLHMHPIQSDMARRVLWKNGMNCLHPDIQSRFAKPVETNLKRLENAMARVVNLLKLGF